MWRFNNGLTNDRIFCYETILKTIAQLYPPDTKIVTLDKLYSDANGDLNEDVVFHYGESSDNDSDDESDIVSDTDVESLFGSLKGSASNDDLTADDDDCDENLNLVDEDVNTDSTSITLKEKTNDPDSSDIEDDIESENDPNMEILSSSISKLRINSVKFWSDEYKNQALCNPISSESTQKEVLRVLSNHPNGVPCPLCGNYMKNERGLKLHMAKKH